jgi:PAS domain S-box-containing protein
MSEPDRTNAEQAADLLGVTESDRLAETASLLLSYSFLFNSWSEGPDANLKVDGETGRIVAVNKQAAPMFGCHATKMIGTLVEDWIPERLRVQHKLHREKYRKFPTNRPMSYGQELVALRADGQTEFPCFINLIFQYDGDKLVVGVTIRRLDPAGVKVPPTHGEVGLIE